MSKTILTLENVTKGYDASEAPVIHDINFDLRDGEILALLGPSGCGKTTTLRAIAGFERPESGTITLDGRVLSDHATWIKPEKRGIGIVFQDYALFPHLNVAQNIAFGLKHLPRKKRKERVEYAIEISGLSGLAKRAPHALSGGQQQRVALARSMAPGPKVILLDEPFSNLDAALRADTRREVRDILLRSGMSAILVTHDQEEALTTADRIAVMNRGRIEQSGTPMEIYRNPATAFVAQFLGETNLIEGTAEGISVDCALGRVDLNQESQGPVLLSIRPEQLAIGPADGSGELEGTVLNRDFKGHDQYYTVGTESATFVVMTDHRSEYREGEKVGLSTTEPVVVVDTTRD